MATTTKWTGLGALAGVLILGLAAPRAEAQPNIYARYGNALQRQNGIYLRNLALIKQGINPYYQVAPGLTINQAAYNTRVMGRAYSFVPPYALGYNPYPSPVFPAYGYPTAYGAPYGVPYGVPYQTPYPGPYNSYVSLYTSP
jgi:hypothetical protein